MANLSSTSIEFTGTTENIAKAHSELKGYMEDGSYLTVGRLKPSLLASAGYSGMEVENMKIVDNEKIVISGSGRWCSPHDYFEDLCERMSLSGKYEDEEAGCNFYHVMVFEDGVKISDVEHEYGSYEHMKEGDINYWIEEREWMAEDENWEEEHSDTIESFKKLGVSIEELRKAYSFTIEMLQGV